jgi:hypothetical protein
MCVCKLYVSSLDTFVQLILLCKSISFGNQTPVASIKKLIGKERKNKFFERDMRRDDRLKSILPACPVGPLASSAPSPPACASLLTAHDPCGCLCLRSEPAAESQQKYFVLKTSAFAAII